MENARHERGTKPSTVPHREVGHGRPSKWPLSSTKSRILAVLWWVAITYAVWVPHVCTDCCTSKIDNIAQVHNDGAGMSSIWVISFSVLLATIPPTWCHSFGILHVYLALSVPTRAHARNSPSPVQSKENAGLNNIFINHKIPAPRSVAWFKPVVVWLSEDVLYRGVSLTESLMWVPVTEGPDILRRDGNPIMHCSGLSCYPAWVAENRNVDY